MKLLRMLPLLLGWSGLASAAELITLRHLPLELAEQAARVALEDCRGQGYQVAVVVVDRGANVQVVLRDDLATRFSIELARDKANAVVMAGVSSGEFRANRDAIRHELNQIDGILLLAGGLPIRAGGTLVAAMGVSGAPGGDKDEVCALKGIEAIQEVLDFAD